MTPQLSILCSLLVLLGLILCSIIQYHRTLLLEGGGEGAYKLASDIRNVCVAMTSAEPDPVVRSYDLMVSHALNDQLFVLQYPNRPAYLPFDSTHLQVASVKPKQTRVRLEYKVPAAGNSARFCPARAQQLTGAIV